MQAASGADAVAQRLSRPDGKAVAVGGDVSKAAERKALVNAAIETFGRLDVLVNQFGESTSSRSSKRSPEETSTTVSIPTY